jgi:PleD family two-component response regulator
MGKPRILIVEDDIDISNMLRLYFSGQNYEVDTALRGSGVMERTRQTLPNAIILDIILPDMDGFEVFRRLRTNVRTSHVPIIFLTQKDERSDKLHGLELGADDYITKPFDIEELNLRIQRAIRRAEQQSLTDPRSGLPSGKLIVEQLRRIIHLKGWEFMDLRINYFEPFKDVYGFVAGDDVLRFAAMLFQEVIDTFGSVTDFIGHPGGDNFVIITSEQTGPQIRSQIKDRFDKEVLSNYGFMDRGQGFIKASSAIGQVEKVPLMSLSIGTVSPSRHKFSDIREITELAAQARRQGR